MSDRLHVGPAHHASEEVARELVGAVVPEEMQRCDDCGAFLPDCDCDQDEPFDPEWACTHCGGEGTCDDGADPLWDCPDELHACHACGGSGKREDQRIF